MLVTVLVVVGAYLFLCVIFYITQDLYFFRPEILSHTFKYQYAFPFEEHNFDTPDGGRINAIHFKVPNSRGVIYYLKGNSRSIKGWGKFAKDFLSNGYDFFMMDYRGFGKSIGKRTQAKLFDDTQLLYDWLAGQYGEDRIVVYGRSLGTGMAAWVASKNKPRMLVLDSPYRNFFRNANRFGFILPLRLLLRYTLKTDEYLSTVSCPVHIIHGTSDRLISFRQSEELKALHPDKVILHPVQGGHHNDLPEFPAFFELLYDILYVQPKKP